MDGDGRQILILMPLVMASIKGVAKNRKNEAQGYHFRSIDDVYPVCKAALVEHGVTLEPQFSDREQKSHTARSGSIQVHVCLRLRLRFLAPDGSFVDAITYGEGMDSGDKATNKAMSAALKYALIDTFQIPVLTERDSEYQKRERKAKRSRKDAAPDEVLALDIAERAKACESLKEIDGLAVEKRDVKNPKALLWLDEQLEAARCRLSGRPLPLADSPEEMALAKASANDAPDADGLQF